MQVKGQVRKPSEGTLGLRVYGHDQAVVGPAHHGNALRWNLEHLSFSRSILLPKT